MTVAFASVTVAGDWIAKSTAGDHPNISSSTINAAKSVNRYWSLTNSGLTFTDYSATFTFVAGDVDGGANTSGFIVGKYGAGWTYPTVGTKTATTTQITGVTSFSDFQLRRASRQRDLGQGLRGRELRRRRRAQLDDGLRQRRSARSAARVELFDGAGAFVTSTTTDGSGNYAFSGVAAGNYTVRVVSSSVTSSRTGYVAALIPVMTFRTNASTGTAVDVTDYVGGHDPATADAGNAAAGWILNCATGVFSGSGSGKAHAFAPVTVSAANVTGVDFGWNFDTIVNMNNTGQGSLRQFLVIANTLGGDASLAQSGLVPAKENAVFMIRNGTAAAGLRAANNYFSGGVATIAPASALPTISTPMVLDAQKQPGWSAAPIIELDGINAGSTTHGLNVTAEAARSAGWSSTTSATRESTSTAETATSSPGTTSEPTRPGPRPCRTAGARCRTASASAKHPPRRATSSADRRRRTAT